MLKHRKEEAASAKLEEQLLRQELFTTKDSVHSGGNNDDEVNKFVLDSCSLRAQLFCGLFRIMKH